MAKALQLDVLDDLREAVERALSEGRTFRQFSRDLTPILQKKGWWGSKERIDPGDPKGRPRRVRLGSPRRLRTIYRSNLRAARAAGQWQRIQRTRDTHPYLLYELGPSEQHRPQHVAWAGTILPADDPWWQTHMPPNGWGCKCRVRQISRREAERLGGVTERPPEDLVEWTNKRTGVTQQVDRGLDPAWAGNPGVDREKVLLDSLAGKIDLADQDLARAAVRQVLESPLLDRHLGPGRPGWHKGDLPIAYLGRHFAEVLGAQTQVARLRARTAEKQRRQHRDIQPDDYRRLLGRLDLYEDAWTETGHYSRRDTDLVFTVRDQGRLWKIVLVRESPRRIRLGTLHVWNQEQRDEALKRPGVTMIRRR